MDIWAHTVISTIIAAILWPFFGVWSLLALVGGALIDGDHVLWYMVRRKEFNLKNNYRYCKTIASTHNYIEYNRAIMICHTYEFLLLTIIISIFFAEFWPFVIGLIAHLIADTYYMYYRWKKFYFLHMFKHSMIKFFYRVLFKKDYYKNL